MVLRKRLSQVGASLGFHHLVEQVVDLLHHVFANTDLPGVVIAPKGPLDESIACDRLHEGGVHWYACCVAAGGNRAQSRRCFAVKSCSWLNDAYTAFI